MEWKNYLELDPNRDLYNKYLLNMNNNNLDSKYPYNNYNNKIDYYSIINDKSNSPSDLDDEEDNYFLFPFKEEEAKKLNKLSSNLIDNKNKEINNKKNLFKIQTFSSTSKDDSKNKEFSLSDDINNSNVVSNSNNNNSTNFFQNIPLKERMKIKKEKTKKLLENKTLRSKTDEESKENNMDKNDMIMNNNKNLESNININNYNFNINNIDKSILSQLSKKEIKMWRNRLSAQRSRDRKKKELLDLKSITKSLLQENEKLRQGIKERDNKINQLMNLLCPECKNRLNGKNDFNISINTNMDSLTNNELNLQDKSQLTPSSIIGGKKKLALLMTGLFTIFCVFGTLINPSENNLLRTLKEKGGNKNSTKLNFDNEKRVNVPFLIEKDYTIRHQKEIEMYQKIKKNNLKNKNMMVPASLFTNNSEQIFSSINNKANNANNVSETEMNISHNENVTDKNENKFLSNGKIKIIEKEYSNKDNDDIKNEINMK
jgi:hypothetical protein